MQPSARHSQEVAGAGGGGVCLWAARARHPPGPRGGGVAPPPHGILRMWRARAGPICFARPVGTTSQRDEAVVTARDPGTSGAVERRYT